MDTRLIQTPRDYGQLSLSLALSSFFAVDLTLFMDTPLIKYRMFNIILVNLCKTFHLKTQEKSFFFTQLFYISSDWTKDY